MEQFSFCWLILTQNFTNRSSNFLVIADGLSTWSNAPLTLNLRRNTAVCGLTHTELLIRVIPLNTGFLFNDGRHFIVSFVASNCGSVLDCLNGFPHLDLVVQLFVLRQNDFSFVFLSLKLINVSFSYKTVRFFIKLLLLKNFSWIVWIILVRSTVILRGTISTDFLIQYLDIVITWVWIEIHAYKWLSNHWAARHLSRTLRIKVQF